MCKDVLLTRISDTRRLIPPMNNSQTIRLYISTKVVFKMNIWLLECKGNETLFLCELFTRI